MTATSIPTTLGPVSVDAATPEPGLIVFEAPEFAFPQSTYRWLLAHHEGHVLAGFESEDAAESAAARLAPLVDWTRSVMTAAQEISLSLEGGAPGFLALLQELGGHSPNQ